MGVYQAQSQMNREYKNKNIKIVDKKEVLCNNNKVEHETLQIKSDYIIMKSTAYDLSLQCCGKSYSNPSRGITRDGYNLNNKSHSEAWTVSSNKFPLGTKLKLEFPQSHSKWNGIYTVRDTGNFKDNVLDVYVGDFGEKVSQKAIEFGRVEVKVEIIK